MNRSLSDAIMPFGEHLEELRRRLVYALVAIVPILIGSLAYGKTFLELLVQPVTSALLRAGLPASLIQTGALEAFAAYVKISLIVTLIVASPWILLQLWLFVAPGLYGNEKRFAYILAPLSTVLTFLGLAFLFKVMLPVMLFFLIQFGTSIGGTPQTQAPTAPLPAGVVLPQVPALSADPPGVQPGQMWFHEPSRQLRICVGLDASGDPLVYQTPLTVNTLIRQEYRVAEYVDLVLILALTFALAFQMPVAVLLLGWAGIIQPDLLRRHRKHALFVCAILGALLTPTGDPITMVMLAGPLYGLYELGLLLLRLLPAHRVSEGFDSITRWRKRKDESSREIDADGGDGGGP